jgi:hypothetical protein
MFRESVSLLSNYEGFNFYKPFKTLNFAKITSTLGVALRLCWWDYQYCFPHRPIGPAVYKGLTWVFCCPVTIFFLIMFYTFASAWVAGCSFSPIRTI